MIEENLDLGRDLKSGDILDKDVFPLLYLSPGERVHCYVCAGLSEGRLEEAKPLTRSSGIFTNRIRCDQDAPVYLCLEHLPFTHRQFEAFSTEVEETLIKNLREKQRLTV